MNNRQLQQAIGQIDDDLITAYDNPQAMDTEATGLDHRPITREKLRFHGWRRVAVIAAGFCLIAAVGLAGALRLFPIGGSMAGGSGGAVMQIPADAKEIGRAHV